MTAPSILHSNVDPDNHFETSNKSKPSTSKCAGCHQPFPEAELLPISDGGIRVCAECYPESVKLILTPGAEA